METIIHLAIEESYFVRLLPPKMRFDSKCCFRTENSNHFSSSFAFNSFLEFSSRHDRRSTIDYTLLITKKNR